MCQPAHALLKGLCLGKLVAVSPLPGCTSWAKADSAVVKLWIRSDLVFPVRCGGYMCTSELHFQQLLQSYSLCSQKVWGSTAEAQHPACVAEVMQVCVPCLGLSSLLLSLCFPCSLFSLSDACLISLRTDKTHQPRRNQWSRKRQVNFSGGAFDECHG